MRKKFTVQYRLSYSRIFHANHPVHRDSDPRDKRIKKLFATAD